MTPEACAHFPRLSGPHPPLVTEWGQGASYQLWPAQIMAMQNLETCFAANKPKALIQMTWEA